VAAPVDRRSRKVYVLWGIALTLLVSTAIFCWLVVVPVWQVRTIVRASLPKTKLGKGEWKAAALAARERLGGCPAACKKLSAYLSLPEGIAPRREFAAFALGFCGKRAGRQLLTCLRDADTDVRVNAAGSLARLGESGSGAVPHIIIIHASGTGHCTHHYWGEIPVGVGPWPQDAAQVLCNSLKDDSDYVRANAAAALGAMKSRDPAALTALTECLGDGYEVVRLNAAWALGRAGHHQALERLEVAVKDKDEHVRRAAADALKKIKGEQE
jgi:hypothetical protein